MKQLVEERGATAQGVESVLREQIIAGAFAPGAQLPTRVELIERFGTTNVTIQRALDRLRDGEWVEATRRGTFVSPSPPHLARYGLVFRQPLHDVMHPLSRLYGALHQEAIRLENEREGELRFAVFAGVDNHSDNPQLRRLIEQVHAQRFAGLIFADGIYELAATPLIGADLPCVVLSGEEFRGVARLQLDWDSWLEKSLDYLQSRGKNRLAVISHRNEGDPFNAQIAEKARARGLEIPPFWMQCTTVEFARAARPLAHLLMQSQPRPDALLVTDDNLVESASAGLLAAGVSIPEELEVVAHCNLPWLTPSVVPFTRIGFDVRQMLALALDALQSAQRGENRAPRIRLEATFAA